MTIWPSICEMLSSTLSRIGCEKLGSMPGNRPTARRSSGRADDPSSTLLRPLRCGLRSTKNSAMLISLGSVPSSGRPAFEIDRASLPGTCRRIVPHRAPAASTLSVTEMLGRQREVDPERAFVELGQELGAELRHEQQAAPSSATTAAAEHERTGDRSAQRSTGRYSALRRRARPGSPSRGSRLRSSRIAQQRHEREREQALRPAPRRPCTPSARRCGPRRAAA